MEREFPEYYDAYVSLPKDVERSDFFRYLIVLHTGGVYADIDTECRQPMDSSLRSTDTPWLWAGRTSSERMRWRTAGTSSAEGRCSTGCSGRAGAPGAERDLRSHREVGAPRLHEQHKQGHAREDGARGVHRRHRPAVLAAFEGDGGGEGCPAPRATSAWGTGGHPRGAGEARGGEEAGAQDEGPKGRRMERQGDAEGFLGVHPTGEDGVPFDDPGVLVAHHFLGS